jgi:hypothetical protein
VGALVKVCAAVRFNSIISLQYDGRKKPFNVRYSFVEIQTPFSSERIVDPVGVYWYKV